MIRPMTAADLPAVRSLQQYLRYAEPALVDAAVRGPFRGRVAVEDAPVGYAIAFPGQPATLSELVVAPEYRRRGHGRALVEAVSEAIEATAIEVTTPADNAAAKRFYASLGFEPDGRIRGFYADGTDALGLVRRE
jgi:ribosomal-protein-alanine N-acetyltransferase